MISINKVQLCGNLTRDPEIRETANGKMARISLATNRRYRDRETKEVKEQVQFHDVVIFQERLVETVEKYCQKGTQVLVEGALEHRSYADKDGNKRYVSEVVLRSFNSDLQLGTRPGEGSGGGSDRDDRGGDRGGRGIYDRDNNRGRDDSSSNNSGSSNRSRQEDFDDDDIPF